MIDEIDEFFLKKNMLPSFITRIPVQFTGSYRCVITNSCFCIVHCLMHLQCRIYRFTFQCQYAECTFMYSSQRFFVYKAFKAFYT